MRTLQRRIEALERKRDDAILTIIRHLDDGSSVTRFAGPNKIEAREIDATELAKLLASGTFVAIRRTYVED